MIENILILAPHIDDEILGCGGIISRSSREGAKISIAILTNGNVGVPELFPIEGTLKGRDEAKRAHNLLGVNDTFFFDFPAVSLDNFPAHKISIEIENLIRKNNIDTLYVPHRGDLHKDHRIVFEAALVAARPINNISIVKILAYETLSETEWAAPFADDAFIPNYFVEISAGNLKDKLNAFNCFSPPRRKQFPHPRSENGIKNLASLRGSTINRPYAEAFMLIREVR